MMIRSDKPRPGFAWFNSLRWWWKRQLGWPGLGAVLLSGAAAVLALVVRPALLESQRQLASASQSLEAGLLPHRSQMNETDPRDALRASLPSLSQRGHVVEKLVLELAKSKLKTERVEYQTEDYEAQLLRLRVTVPFAGTYQASRELTARLLNQMPNCALDEIQLEQGSEAGDGLTGQLRLSLFFRKETP